MPQSPYRTEVFGIESFRLASGLSHYNDINKEKVKGKAIKSKKVISSGNF